MSETTYSLSEALRRAGAAMRLSAVLQGLARWLGVCGLLWLGVCLADNLLHLPAALRLPVGIALVAFTAWHLFHYVLRHEIVAVIPLRPVVCPTVRFDDIS